MIQIKLTCNKTLIGLKNLSTELHELSQAKYNISIRLWVELFLYDQAAAFLKICAILKKKNFCFQD